MYRKARQEVRQKKKQQADRNKARKKFDWKSVLEKVQHPPAWVMLLVFSTMFTTVFLSVIALAMGRGGTPLAIVFYTASLLTLAYCVYMSVGWVQGMGRKVSKVADRYAFTRHLKDDFEFRTIVFTVIAFICNVAYTVFLCGMAMYSRTLWYGALAVYYIILTSARGGILLEKRKTERRFGGNAERLYKERVKTYLNCGVMLLSLTGALAAAVVQMAVAGERLHSSHFMLAGFTVFAVYRVAMAAHNFAKGRSVDDLSLRAVGNLNFAAALVSALSLQTALLDYFVPTTAANIANGVTGAIVCAAIVALGVYMIKFALGERRKIENNQIGETENMEKAKKYYVGIDLGGTFIKGGIVDNEGNILVSDKTPTEREKGAEGVAENIANLALDLLARAGVSKEDAVGLGMGVPGMIDSKAGNVIFAGNFGWKDFKIGEAVEKRIGMPVKIANDANVAALGEVKFGAAKDREHVVMLTLGTGVGGGVIADGKMLEGYKSAGMELGHKVIVARGEQCTCGRKGCLEAYASATALIRDTKRAMEAHKDSKMWEIGSLDKVTGKTAFDYRDTDVYAKEVVDGYIYHLGVGITDFANIFRPQVVLLGGGVCAQGDNLVKPLQKILNEELFAGELGPQVEILTATLGNEAGLLGAAAMLMD